VTCPAPGEVVEVEPGTAATLRGCDIPVGVTFRTYYGADMEPLADTPDEPLPTPTSPASAVPAELPKGESPVPEGAQAQALSPDAMPDLAQIEGMAGGNPMLMLAVLLVMVLGGGAGWKFWTQYSEQKHQQALERIRLERDMAGHGGASPPPCQTAHAALEKRIDAIDKRLSDTTRKVGTVIRPDSPGVEELDERLTRVEKQIKALARDR